MSSNYRSRKLVLEALLMKQKAMSFKDVEERKLEKFMSGIGHFLSTVCVTDVEQACQMLE